MMQGRHTVYDKQVSSKASRFVVRELRCGPQPPKTAAQEPTRQAQALLDLGHFVVCVYLARTPVTSRPRRYKAIRVTKQTSKPRKDVGAKRTWPVHKRTILMHELDRTHNGLSNTITLRARAKLRSALDRTIASEAGLRRYVAVVSARARSLMQSSKTIPRSALVPRNDPRPSMPELIRTVQCSRVHLENAYAMRHVMQHSNDLHSSGLDSSHVTRMAED